jgi:hypothetical protein
VATVFPPATSPANGRPVQRLATKRELARYLGVSDRTIPLWVAKALLPLPLPGTNRWGLRAVDQRLDELSGLTPGRRPIRFSQGPGRASE